MQRRNVTNTVRPRKPQNEKVNSVVGQSVRPTCVSCDLVFDGKTGSKFCDVCQFWSHPYHYNADFCVSNSTPECIFCEQLKRREQPANLSYENQEELDYVDEQEPPGRFANGVRSISENPRGSPSEWTYFYNYQHKDGFNVKLGDGVYVAQHTKDENAAALELQKIAKKKPRAVIPYAYALRVDYIIEDTEKNVFVSGFHLFSSKQMAGEEKIELEFHVESEDESAYRENLKKFPKAMANVTDSRGWAPIDAITKLFCPLYLKDYKYGEPTMFNKADVFPVIFNYTYNDKGVELAKYSENFYSKRCSNPKMFRPLDKNLAKNKKDELVQASEKSLP